MKWAYANRVLKERKYASMKAGVAKWLKRASHRWERRQAKRWLREVEA